MYVSAYIHPGVSMCMHVLGGREGGEKSERVRVRE